MTPSAGRTLTSVTSEHSFKMGRLQFSSVKGEDANGSLIRERSFGLAFKKDPTTGQAEGHTLMRETTKETSPDGTESKTTTWTRGSTNRFGFEKLHTFTHGHAKGPEGQYRVSITGSTARYPSEGGEKMVVRKEDGGFRERGEGGNWRGTRGNSSSTSVRRSQTVSEPSGNGTYVDNVVRRSSVQPAQEGKQHKILRFLNRSGKENTTTEFLIADTNGQTTGGRVTSAQTTAKDVIKAPAQ
jgi:hypothetical protein